MANQAKKTKKSSASSKDSNVVRIKASSAPSTKKTDAGEKVTKVVASTSTAKAKKINVPKVKAPKLSGKGALRPVKATGNYFKGAWEELRLVRWPSRRATWGLTGAVILYSAFFVVLVLLLDAVFKYLFELILGK